MATIKKCDRCPNLCESNVPSKHNIENTMSAIELVSENQNGVSTTDVSLDLCKNCWELFYKFMDNTPEESKDNLRCSHCKALYMNPLTNKRGYCGRFQREMKETSRPCYFFERIGTK